MNYDVNFDEVLDASLNSFKIMENRDKGETIDLVGKDITIDNFEWCEMGEKSCWAYTVENDKNNFYFAGSALAGIFENALEKFEGSYTDLYNAYRGAKNKFRVKLSNTKTSRGQNYTKVERVK